MTAILWKEECSFFFFFFPHLSGSAAVDIESLFRVAGVGPLQLKKHWEEIQPREVTKAASKGKEFSF